MFDISWTEIMVIGVVALLVVGPKELPALLRTVGRYVGMIKHQAAEFRAQFDEAMRESELEQLKKEVETAGREMAATVQDAERSVQTEIHDAKREFALSPGPATPALEASGAITAPPLIEATVSANGAPREGLTREDLNGAGAAAGPPRDEAQAKTGA
jgi:sec-independent protein translocase protein TatB